MTLHVQIRIVAPSASAAGTHSWVGSTARTAPEHDEMMNVHVLLVTVMGGFWAMIAYDSTWSGAKAIATTWPAKLPLRENSCSGSAA